MNSIYKQIENKVENGLEIVQTGYEPLKGRRYVDLQKTLKAKE